MNQKGFTMIELMLVIVIAAVIILLGLQYYRNANRLMQLSLVANDVTTIREALNRFYDAIPCDGNGVLQNDLNMDVIAQLDIPHPLIGRQPYVDNYHAVIVDSGVTTDQQKPVYTLEVSADVDFVYGSIMNSLTQRWSATRYNNNTIYWDSLSNNSTTDPGSDLWDLNVSTDAFRNLKNDATLSTGGYSHAYCAK
jgi:prepilin-type N-terminal cleavage/methylation domain-containing protein